jgi:hypothetical protein|tara:strand:+ start:480 stop:1499 length:1020 start_codon:yes stop_codon:yes gene_type:complete
MTTYKEIKGTQIEVLSSDPSNPVEGQVWYNSTSNVLKGSIRTGAAAWATANAMSTGRWGGGASSVSPQSDAIMASGANTANVELYNGTNWTEVNNVNQKRYGMWGTGTSTSMIVFGGNIPGSSPTASGDLNSTELWNGTNWTEVNNLNEVKRYPGGAGSSNTNSLCFGSFNGTNQVAKTETWNGTNWTEVNDLSSARSSVVGIGADNTAALCAGGNVAPPGANGSAEAESWNGTNWTEVNDMNTARRDLGGTGTNTLGLVFGGLKPPGTWYGVTESWNGSNWTETSDMNTAREITGQAAGSTTAALACGGITGPPGTYVTTVEEFTGAGASITRTFTDS